MKLFFTDMNMVAIVKKEKDFEDLKDHLENTRTSVFDVRVEPIKKGSKVI